MHAIKVYNHPDDLYNACHDGVSVIGTVTLPGYSGFVVQRPSIRGDGTNYTYLHVCPVPWTQLRYLWPCPDHSLDTVLAGVEYNPHDPDAGHHCGVWYEYLGHGFCNVTVVGLAGARTVIMHIHPDTCKGNGWSELGAVRY